MVNILYMRIKELKRYDEEICQCNNQFRFLPVAGAAAPSAPLNLCCWKRVLKIFNAAPTTPLKWVQFWPELQEPVDIAEDKFLLQTNSAELHWFCQKVSHGFKLHFIKSFFFLSFLKQITSQ